MQIPDWESLWIRLAARIRFERLALSRITEMEISLGLIFSGLDGRDNLAEGVTKEDTLVF